MEPGTHIYTIGSGKRVQYSRRDDGFWFVRHKRDQGKGWGAWVPTGSKNYPENIWYNPALGRAHLPKDLIV